MADEQRNWYKGKDFAFKLIDLNVTEDFTIWKAWDKRNEEMKDGTGNVMKFPIRKGQLVDADGNVKEITDVRYMKNDVFKTAFPKLGRNTRFNRNIVVSGQQYTFGFTKTSNDKLVEILDTCIATNADPLGLTFQQSYNASEAPMSKYSMKILTSTGVVSKSGPSVKEQEVMDAIKSKFKEKISVIRFVEIMKANGISEKRAKELFK